MEDNTGKGLINESFLWGINININDKAFSNKDIFNSGDNNKLKIDCENYDDILKNIELIKNESDLFLQNIIDQNPHLKNIKEKKENVEAEEEIMI